MDLLVAILVVLGAAVASALALWLVYRIASRALLIDSGRGRPLLTVTGTLFAVVLAFVILAAFETYDGARSGAASEADAVLEMARLAAFYPGPQRDRLRTELVCYGRAVVNEEWPAMSRGRSDPLVDYWTGVFRADLARLTLRSPREQLAFQELLTLAANRTAGRQQRLSDDTPTVPLPLWLALIFGGSVTVLLELGMADPRERLRVHALLLAGLASVVAAGLLVVFFLDHPYQGDVGRIQPTAMRHSLALMHGIEPGLRPACTFDGRPTTFT